MRSGEHDTNSRLMRLKMHALRLVIVVSFCLCVTPSQNFAVAAERPNVLLILADDLGWSDLSAYGHSWHRTPHLNALAAGGKRFTAAYAAAPICSASRAALLTGRSTARLNFEFVTKYEPGRQQIDLPVPLLTPEYTLNLPLRERTIAECLADVGYRTAFFGKWHLNAHHQRYLGWSPTLGPLQQGFMTAEEDFGSHPYSWGKRTPVPITRRGEYADDSMISRAVEFLQQDHADPFFLMVSLFHVHTPVRTRHRWLQQEYAAQLPASLPARQRRVDYAAFVTELDHQVGRLLQALHDSGTHSNTLVLFTSDNGGHPEYTANAPLRGSKWNLYEGGIRVPLLASWPGRIAENSVCDGAVCGIDLLPTLLELAGGPLPAELDGRSIVRELFSETGSASRELYWHFPYYHPETGYADALPAIGMNDFAVSRTQPHSALRSGNNKLLYFHEDQRRELYNLATDPGELTDLSDRDPNLAADLQRRLLQLLEGVDARFPVRR